MSGSTRPTITVGLLTRRARLATGALNAGRIRGGASMTWSGRSVASAVVQHSAQCSRWYGRGSMDRPTTRQMTLAISIPFAISEGRLPSRARLALRCGDDLDLLLFGFLGLPIASLLAFGH